MLSQLAKLSDRLDTSDPSNTATATIIAGIKNRDFFRIEVMLEADIK